jgi:hypothetical protein
LKLRRVGWKKLQVYPFGHLYLFALVPSGLVEDQYQTPILTTANLLGEVRECHRENLRVDCGQDQPVDLSTLGAHKTYPEGIMGKSR